MGHRKTKAGNLIRIQGIASRSHIIEVCNGGPGDKQRVVTILRQGFEGFSIPGGHTNGLAQCLTTRQRGLTKAQAQATGTLDRVLAQHQHGVVIFHLPGRGRWQAGMALQVIHQVKAGLFPRLNAGGEIFHADQCLQLVITLQAGPWRADADHPARMAQSVADTGQSGVHFEADRITVWRFPAFRQSRPV